MSSELAVQRQPQSGGAMTEVASTRAAQEVQAAMVVAKKFPRDTTAAHGRIIEACRRVGMAEVAQYAYPRGNSIVTGPSIRLAEAIAQNWGNLDFGIVELEQGRGESTVMAYCWDLETNTRQTKIFTQPHVRYTKSGTYALKDPRDIYELVANNGARRLRACILGVIPGDIVEDAVAECERTLRGDNKEPIAARIRKMVAAFAEHGVTQDRIEARMGHKVDSLIETELVTLRKFFTAIKDGLAKADEVFPVIQEAGAAPKGVAGVAEQLKNQAKPPAEKPPAKPKPAAKAPAPAPKDSRLCPTTDAEGFPVPVTQIRLDAETDQAPTKKSMQALAISMKDFDEQHLALIREAYGVDSRAHMSAAQVDELRAWVQALVARRPKAPETALDEPAGEMF